MRKAFLVLLLAASLAAGSEAVAVGAVLPAPLDAADPSFQPAQSLCASADIDGPATVCLLPDGSGVAYRRTPSADVVLALKSPDSRDWVIRRPASGVDCGRVDEVLPVDLIFECINLDYYFKKDQILNSR